MPELRRAAGTLRFRITAVSVVVAAVVLVLAAMALVGNQRRLLREDLDDTLRARVDAVAAVIEANGVPDRLPGATATDTVAVRVVDGQGRTLAQSGVVAEEADDEPALPAPGGGDDLLRTDQDEELRILSRSVATATGSVVVHAVGSLEEVEESAEVLERQLRVGVPAAALVLAALTWWLVGRTLRPVEAIRSEVAAIGADDLGRRVPEPSGDDEVARLARTMNAMLGRVEASVVRQRAFVADASHELRTPLTRMRAELEVDRAHPDVADRAATQESLLEEVEGLQRLVEDLLHLAGQDEGAGPARRAAVDLDDLVLREAERLRSEGRVRVDATGVSAAQVVGDRDQLGRLVRNLTDNAARHAASVVTLRLAEVDGEARLAVDDDGPGIPAADRERVFERFTRLDGTRGAVDGGTGLGLAIARAVAVRHGGDLRVDPAVGPPGTRMLVSLPASDQVAG